MTALRNRWHFLRNHISGGFLVYYETRCHTIWWSHQVKRDSKMRSERWKLNTPCESFHGHLDSSVAALLASQIRSGGGPLIFNKYLRTLEALWPLRSARIKVAVNGFTEPSWRKFPEWALRFQPFLLFISPPWKLTQSTSNQVCWNIGGAI